MGAITKIRQLSPFVLATVAVLFIAFMVIQDSSCDTIKRSAESPDKRTAFSVNGEVVTVTEYETRVLRIKNSQKIADPKAEIDEDQVRQQVYDMMVAEKILEQEARKLGIVISPEELREVMLVNPPKDVRDRFPDTLNGFNRELYEEVLLAPEKFLERLRKNNVPEDEIAKRMAQVYALPLDLEDQLRFTKLQEALSATTTAANSIVSPTYALWNYTKDNSTADVNFVAIDVKRVQDSEVSVSDADIQAYYDTHKEGYEQKPSRRLKYIAFAAVPALKDSQNAAKASTKLQTALNSLQTIEKRDSLFTIELAAKNGKEHDYTSPSKIDPNQLMVLLSLQPREVFGPLETQTGITYLRLDARRTDNPSVRASHILIPMTPANKDSAKAEAEKIAARVRKGEDFSLLAYQYSGDPGSKQKGGDVDYVSQETPFVEPFKNAVLKPGNKVGDILGPIETTYGYHIIKITDIQAEQLKYSEITIKPIFSSTTRNHIRAMAQEAVKKIEAGATIDQVAKDMKQPVLETALFQRGEPTLGSHPLATWAFENEKGAVTRKEVKSLGTVVAQVTDTRSEGIKPLEDVKDQIKSILIPKKKLDKLKALAEQVAGAIKSGGFGAINSMDSTLKVNMQTGVKNNGMLTGYGAEYVVTNKVFTQPLNVIEGPIRGDRAWFIVQVTNRTMADQSKFAAALPGLRTTLGQSLQGEAFGVWFQKAKENAEIIDERYKEQQ